MTPLVGAVLLQAAPAPGAPSPFGFLLPMVVIFVIFYFLLIRPQTKRQREHEDMLKKIDKGDRIVTTGGLLGAVVGVTDDVLTLEIGAAGQKLRVKVDRKSVDRLLGKGGETE